VCIGTMQRCSEMNHNNRKPQTKRRNVVAKPEVLYSSILKQRHWEETRYCK